jgi:hypothetical protein
LCAEIDATSTKLVDYVERNLAHGLHRVGMEEHAALMADFADFADGLQHADFVVGRHDADENGLVVDGALQVFEIDGAVGHHRQIRHTGAVFFQPLARIEHGFVLGHLRDHVVAALAVHFRNALEGQVVALRGAGGEDDLFGGRADQPGDLLAGRIHGLLRLPSKGVVAAGRVAELPWSSKAASPSSTLGSRGVVAWLSMF